ncbi:MAG TPA: hypothetical protein VFB62_17165 [Polyangiaceae bacterium]|nr:hypothetical protein [Polyangiaceae bacterium]
MSPLPATSVPHQPLWLSAVSSGRFFVWNDAWGASYDWRTDTWNPIAAMGGPQLPAQYLLRGAIGTPANIIYLRNNSYKTSKLANTRYEIATDAWHPISDQRAPSASFPAIVPTDSAVVVWGGTIAPQRATNEGARLDLSSMTWRPITTKGAPQPSSAPVGVWTGRHVFVWGVGAGSTDGGLYDPARDAWTPVSQDAAPTKKPFLAVWTGKRVIVLGQEAGGYGIYDPHHDAWHPMMPPPKSQFVFFVAQWDRCRLLAYRPSELLLYTPPAGT